MGLALTHSSCSDCVLSEGDAHRALALCSASGASPGSTRSASRAYGGVEVGGREGFTRSEKPYPMLLVLVSLCYSMMLIRCYA
jgi:hypothetical protein